MTFRYRQSTGELFDSNDVLLGIGYAGHGEGVNAPEKQNVRNVGPLPRGKYQIGQPMNHPMLGPIAIPLIPDPANEMFGRSAFYIHGAKRNDAKRISSLGCIIQGPLVRRKVAEAVGETLEVTV